MVTSFTLIIPLLSASTWYNKNADISENANNYINMALHNLTISESDAWMRIFLNIS
jgi:hypothetical protein